MFSVLLGKQPWFGASRLCRAAENGDLDTVKSLATTDLVNQLGWLGWAPLHKGMSYAQKEGRSACRHTFND